MHSQTRDTKLLLNLCSEKLNRAMNLIIVAANII